MDAFPFCMHPGNTVVRQSIGCGSGISIFSLLVRERWLIAQNNHLSAGLALKDMLPLLLAPPPHMHPRVSDTGTLSYTDEFHMKFQIIFFKLIPKALSRLLIFWGTN